MKKTYCDLGEIDYTEANDCSVFTVADLFEISYIEAQRQLSLLGRVHGEGFRASKLLFNTINNRQLIPFQIRRGYKVKALESVKKLKVGRFMISIEGHVFSMVDGLVLDRASEDFNFSEEKVQEVYVVKMNKFF